MSQNAVNLNRAPVVNPGVQEATGPRGQFLLGSIRDVTRDRIRFIMELGLRYGDVSVFRMGPLPIYMINHPDGVKRVLQDNNHNYSKETPVLELLRGLLGTGLFLSEGEFWLRQRRLMQPMFHRQKIAAFGEIMTRVAQETVENWRKAVRPGGEVDIAREMMRLTLDVACRSLFSVDIRQEAQTIEQAVNVLLEDFIFRFDHPFYPPVKVPTLRNRRYLANIAALDRIVYGMIEQRRKSKESKNDLLSLLLDVHDEETGEGMTDKQVRDELMTLLIAGHETTAVTLTWAFYLLSMHPQAEQRVYEEVLGVVGERQPVVSDLPKLAYTQRVIDETMRLYPPAYLTNRVAIEEDVVCGYRIPKGASVTVSTFLMQHHPDFWENPEAFDPDRFLPERSVGRPHYAYFPFGGGPRMCIGKGFALVEAPLVLATIVQQCRLFLKPGHEVRMRPLVTLRPDGGMPMTVHFRT